MSYVTFASYMQASLLALLSPAKYNILLASCFHLFAFYTSIRCAPTIVLINIILLIILKQLDGYFRLINLNIHLFKTMGTRLLYIKHHRFAYSKLMVAN